MKNKVKYLRLIGKGFSSKTLNNLSESEINILYNKLFISEQIKRVENVSFEIPPSYKPENEKIGPMPKGVTASSKPDGTIVLTPNESEMKEEDEITFDPDKETETQDPHQVGPSSDDGFTDSSEDGMGIFEEGKKRKKSNPWAICTSQLGGQFKTTKRHLWSAKQKNKYERCVKDVKKSLKEGKNPVSLFLENQIYRIVEKHIPPKITKSDLLNYLLEDTKTAPSKPKTRPKTEPSEKPRTRPSHPGKNPNPGEKTTPKAKKETNEDTTTAPSKPKTKPTTKPSERPRPSHPGKNPNPGEKTTPKAVSPEKAKDEVIKAIMNILEK